MTQPSSDVPRERRVGDRRAQDALADEVREMRTALEGLGSRVEDLSGNLVAVNEVQRQQQATDRRSADAVAQAAKAMAAAQNAAPREDVEKSFEEVAERGLAVIKSLRRQTFIAAVAAVAISALILGIAVYLVIQQTDKQHSSSVKACRDRVAISKSAVKNYDKQLADPRLDPSNVVVFQTLRAISVAGTKVNCG